MCGQWRIKISVLFCKNVDKYTIKMIGLIKPHLQQQFWVCANKTLRFQVKIFVPCTCKSKEPNICNIVCIMYRYIHKSKCTKWVILPKHLLVLIIFSIFTDQMFHTHWFSGNLARLFAGDCSYSTICWSWFSNSMVHLDDVSCICKFSSCLLVGPCAGCPSDEKHRFPFLFMQSINTNTPAIILSETQIINPIINNRRATLLWGFSASE